MNPIKSALLFLLSVLWLWSASAVHASSLDIPIEGYGLSFGNSKNFTGLRFNTVDKNVETINGANFTFGHTLYYFNMNNIFYTGTYNGFNFTVMNSLAKASNGLMFGGMGAHSQSMNGFMFGGGLARTGDLNGIMFGGGMARAGETNGMVFGGGWARTEDMNGIMFSGGLARAGDMTGLMFGGMGAQTKSMNGLMFGGGLARTGDMNGIMFSGGLARTGDMNGLVFGGGLARTGNMNGIMFSGGIRAEEMNGLVFSGAWARTGNLTGALLTGGLARAENVNGIMIGMVASESNEVHGVIGGFYAHVKNEITGVSFSFLNYIPWAPEKKDGNMSRKVTGMAACLGPCAAKMVNGVLLSGLGSSSEIVNGFAGGVVFNSYQTVNGVSMAGLNRAHIFNGFHMGFLTIAGRPVVNTKDTADKGEINGVSLAVLGTVTPQMNGVAMGMLNLTQELNGVQIGLFNYVNKTPPLPPIFRPRRENPLDPHEKDEVYDMSLAVVDTVMHQRNRISRAHSHTAQRIDKKSMNGVSLGLVNYAEELNGVQIGLVNFAMNNPPLLRCLPFINVNLSILKELL